MFTIREANPVLGTEHFRGTFDTREEAEARAAELRAKYQSFMRIEVWHGTRTNPTRPA
jgi:hypothetical protein